MSTDKTPAVLTRTTRKTSSPEETAAFARECARDWPRGTVALLIGGIGSGKTTFVRGFASRWGLDRMVTSPTFTLQNIYRDDEQKITIRHFDLYRLHSAEEARDTGLEDAVADCDYSFIEWPEHAGTLLDFPALIVSFEPGPLENDRTIQIEDRRLS